MKDLRAFLAAAASLACVFASAPVIAEPVPRSLTVNAAGACNGALPSFEGALRKRPTAISNEGAAQRMKSSMWPSRTYARSAPRSASSTSSR